MRSRPDDFLTSSTSLYTISTVIRQERERPVVVIHDRMTTATLEFDTREDAERAARLAREAYERGRREGTK